MVLLIVCTVNEALRCLVNKIVQYNSLKINRKYEPFHFEVTQKYPLLMKLDGLNACFQVGLHSAKILSRLYGPRGCQNDLAFS